MTSHRVIRSVGLVVILLSVIACSENRLRTFSVSQSNGGVPVACDLFGLVDPVRGTLRGDSASREPVWLETEDGRRLSVVRPNGFSVRFAPEAVLYNDKQLQVAMAGREIKLGQVRWDSAAGTFDDPYYASGILFDGCYPRVK